MATPARARAAPANRVLTHESLPALQRSLAEASLDGWLLFDFQGANPVALGMLSLSGMMTRRHVAFIPARGVPKAIIPAIEPWPWSEWPNDWERHSYRGWSEFEEHIRSLVHGKRVAMEYSPGNAIPHLDRVSAGTLELVRNAGADVVSSADLVSRFFATWSPAQLASHQRSAATLAHLATEAFTRVGARARTDAPLTEHEVRDEILAQFATRQLVTDTPPIVAAGAHSADVHYSPSPNRPRPIVEGDVLLVDLWAKEELGVYADQTWMASLGTPTDRLRLVWTAVSEARDAAIAFIRDHVDRGDSVRGAAVHRLAQSILARHGLGEFAVGRLGHSLDQRQLHGAGANLDAVESRDERALLPGTAFTVEPGIYIPGVFGVRSEVNLYIGEHEILITPHDYQKELIVL